MGGQCLKAIEKLLLYACRQQKFAYVNKNSSKNRPGKQFIYCRSTCKAQPEAQERGRGTEAEEIHLPTDKGNKDETRQRKIEMLITRVEVA